MKALQLSMVLAFTATLAAFALAAGDANNCKIVESEAPPAENTGGLSSSVTAGNGHVSARTSGNNGVTMNSGNGSAQVSSSVSTTGSSGRSQTIVTNSDGSCTIYRTKEK